MTQALVLGPMQADPALQAAMYTAYDAAVEKRNRLDKLIAGRAGTEAEIEAAKTNLLTARNAYITGIEASGESGMLSAAAKTAKTQVGVISGRITGFEGVLADFYGPITQAEKELREAVQAFTAARYRIVVAMRQGNPRYDTVAPQRLAFGGVTDSLDLRALLLRYVAGYYGACVEQGRPFGLEPEVPAGFFRFVASCFRSPSREEEDALFAEVERLAWGEREPGGKIPVPPPAR